MERMISSSITRNSGQLNQGLARDFPAMSQFAGPGDWFRRIVEEIHRASGPLFYRRFGSIQSVAAGSIGQFRASATCDPTDIQLRS